MKANQGAIFLIDQPADHGGLRSVLYDWGYTETEIQRFLNENEMRAPVEDSMNEQMLVQHSLLCLVTAGEVKDGLVCWSQSPPEQPLPYYRLVSGNTN